MGELYDADWVRSYYDEYWMSEWNRWDESAVQAVEFAVHQHYLRRYASKDDRVLEVGAGANASAARPRAGRGVGPRLTRPPVRTLSPARATMGRARRA